MKRRHILKYKSYTHLDARKQAKDWIDFVKDPEKIKSHGFLPLIHYTIKTYKFNKETQKAKAKPREIYYASHLDRYVYEYYNHRLSLAYNRYASEKGINQCAVAYRNNLKKTNVDIAKDVFRFLDNQSHDFFVYIEDFSSYFDKIDHEYLKKNLKTVLSCSRLSEDWFKVLKSVTKYSYFDLADLAASFGKNIQEIRKQEIFCTSGEMRQRKQLLRTNLNSFGIPQGTSLSATLSNVNLIDFDCLLNNYTSHRRGIYRRYCDDVLIAVPLLEKDSLMDFLDGLHKSTPGLEVNKDKTKSFQIKNHKALTLEELSTWISYLGFEYNGSRVRLREKTVTNFYTKAYRVIQKVNSISKSSQRNAYRKSFYKSFTHLGSQPPRGKYGNFITYAMKASSKFGRSDIKRQVSSHWKRFEQRLIKIRQDQITPESP